MRDLLLLAGGLLFFLLPAGVAFTRAQHELAGNGRVSVVTFVLALAGYVTLAAAITVASLLNAWPLPISPFLTVTVGGILSLFGAAVYVTARLQFRSFQMAWGLESNRLITSGIYRFVRHPQNLGWGLLLIGVALLGRSGVALLLVGVYALTLMIWLRVEERALERQFGSAYRRYRARTPALIPFTRQAFDEP